MFLTTLLLVLLAPASAFAQSPREAKVSITVVDPAGGVVPGAAVTLIRLDAPTNDGPRPGVQTSEVGIAVFERVTPGRYSIQAQFAGFQPGLLRDIRINPGDNKRVVVLPL